jgi:cytochrome P450
MSELAVMSDPKLSEILRKKEFFDNPYDTYRYMRENAPVFYDQPSKLWFITRHEDVARALDNPSIYSSSRGNALQDTPLRVGKTLGSMDPPRHDQLRGIIGRGLNPRRINAAIPHFRTAVINRIEAVAGQRRCDLVKDITRPVILEVLGIMLGLDAEAAARGAKLQEGLFHHTDGPLGSAMSPEDFGGVIALLRDQLERRKCELSDDLFSVLLEAQASGLQVSNEEIIANMSTVLLAGAASLGHFAPNIFHALWSHPDQAKKVAADLDLLDQAIEEAVRWDTSTQAFARHTLADVTVAGTNIPAGSRLAVVYASANRDSTVIENADTFDIFRSRVRHFGFGGGVHHCLGASAARLFCKSLALELLPALGLCEMDLPAATRVEHFMVRGFVSLPISW